jgi:hypothetical protein
MGELRKTGEQTGTGELRCAERIRFRRAISSAPRMTDIPASLLPICFPSASHLLPSYRCNGYGPLILLVFSILGPRACGCESNAHAREGF